MESLSISLGGDKIQLTKSQRQKGLKKFNKKTFKADSVFGQKNRATRQAKILRQNGLNARVHKKGNNYTVYQRDPTRKGVSVNIFGERDKRGNYTHGGYKYGPGGLNQILVPKKGRK